MSTIIDHINSAFQQFSSPLKEALMKHGRLVHLTKGEELMSIGGQFKTIPLISKGVLKIMRDDDEGNELFLYYLEAGQTCALSLNCFVSDMPSEVRAVAEDDCSIILLSPDVVSEWLDQHKEWKAFVMNTYRIRFHEMLQTIDSLAFKQLDNRLLAYLQEKSEALNQSSIQITHQEIAADINSSREVISRLLKILEKKGQIRLERNKITVL